MLHAVKLDFCNGTSLKTREKNPAEAVGDRMSKTTLEWFSVKNTKRVGKSRSFALDPAWQFQTTPSDSHRCKLRVSEMVPDSIAS
jgi:hypothetical protein